jgi:ParB family transcriptional regulator, chromosome partitioning protein
VKAAGEILRIEGLSSVDDEQVNAIETLEMEIAHLDLRYAHTRITNKGSLVRLAASIEQWGQSMPVITVAPSVLIDGYRRVAALKLCKRDTVLAERWSCGEDQALIRLLAVGCEQRWDVFEQAAIIRELICCHKVSQVRVARLLGKDPSWVSRRLGLLESLPEEVLKKVRSGRLSSWAASRVLAPLARANADHATSLCRWISQKHVSTRELAEFFDHYKCAATITRERMAAEPAIFIKAMGERKKDKEAALLRAGVEGKWLSNLSGLVATLRRLNRQTEALFHLVIKDRNLVVATLKEAKEIIRSIDEKIRSADDRKRPEGGGEDPSAQGDGNPPDQLGSQGIQEHSPQCPSRQGR